MSQAPESLEDRVAYLEENIRALNEATTKTATALKALLAANQAQSNGLTNTLNTALNLVCPFPPECVAPGG